MAARNNSLKKGNTKNKEPNYSLILLVLVIFIVPLIVRLYEYDPWKNPGISPFPWYPSKTEYEYDLFLYWKGHILTIFAVIMAVVLVMKLILHSLSEYKKDWWLYLLLAYGTLAFLSTIFSKYSNYGYSGIHEQFESIWVILSYCILAFFTYTSIHSEKDVKVIRIALLCLLAVLLFIGFSQLIGHDFFETKLGRMLIVPEENKDMRDTLTFNFSGSGNHQVYITLYNPNYVGIFASLILPITIMAAVSVKGIINHIVWSVVSILLFIVTLGSGSKSFILSLMVSVVMVIIFCRKVILRNLKFIVPVMLIAIIGAAAYCSYVNLNIMEYIKYALKVQENNYSLEHVEMTEDDAVFKFKDGDLHASYFMSDENYYFIFTDENGTIVDSEVTDAGLLAVTDARFSGIQFSVYYFNEEFPYIAAGIINNMNIYFASTDSGYQYINNVGRPDTIVKAKTAIFTNYDRLFSGRGFIWSRTIPLLGKYFFLGSGADTFSIAFPHNDYIGRLNGGYYNLLVTKPHNMYLQIGVQHGTVALICFLAICIIYLVQSFILYFKSDMSKSNNLFGLGISLGIFGYLVSGIANDSTVAVAPLFWIFLGLGYAVNKLNKSSEAEKAA